MLAADFEIQCYFFKNDVIAEKMLEIICIIYVWNLTACTAKIL